MLVVPELKTEWLLTPQKKFSAAMKSPLPMRSGDARIALICESVPSPELAVSDT